jgi:hypothetical protein
MVVKSWCRVLRAACCFLEPRGAMTPLNELAVVMDVGPVPVREQNVCCAMVQHKPKEGSLWWKICGGTGAHTHQGLSFCGRHQRYHRTQYAGVRQNSKFYDEYCCVQQ